MRKPIPESLTPQARRLHAPYVRIHVRHRYHHLCVIRLIIIDIVILECFVIASLLIHHVDHPLQLLIL